MVVDSFTAGGTFILLNNMHNFNKFLKHDWLQLYVQLVRTNEVIVAVEGLRLLEAISSEESKERKEKKKYPVLRVLDFIQSTFIKKKCPIEPLQSASQVSGTFHISDIELLLRLVCWDKRGARTTSKSVLANYRTSPTKEGTIGHGTEKVICSICPSCIFFKLAFRSGTLSSLIPMSRT
jgi:hypothetical protein